MVFLPGAVFSSGEIPAGDLQGDRGSGGRAPDVGYRGPLAPQGRGNLVGQNHRGCTRGQPQRRQVERLSKRISEQARPVLQVEDIRAIGEGRQLLKLPGYPLFVAERIPFFEIDPFRDQIGDVREVA